MKLSRAIVASSIATLMPFLAVASASAETAYPAAAFKDSIGVNTKLAAPQTAYYNRDYGDRQNAAEAGVSAAGEVRTLLASLGIKHIRYDFCSFSFPNCRRGNATARMLYDQLGVRTLDDYFGSSARSVDRLGTPEGISREVYENLAVAALYRNADGSGPVEALEGPNEFDRFGTRYRDWAARLAHAQALADRKVNRSPLTRKLGSAAFLPPPLGFPNANLASPNQLVGWRGDASFQAWNNAPLDGANQHHYSYFDCPEAAVQGVAVSTSCSTVSMPKIQCPTAGNPIWLRCADLITGGSTKPIWITETGYTTATGSLEGVPDAVAAAYLPRLLLEGWRQQAEPGRRAWARTYLYELIDSREGRYCVNLSCDGDREAGHGLASANYQLKGQGRALKRLLDVLDDPGAPVTGAATTLDIGVAPSDASQVRRLLFRKRNGQHVLAIWRPVKLWQNGSRNWWGGVDRGRLVAEGAAVDTTITLPSASPISIDRPSIDGAARETRPAARSFRVPARGDVTLVTIG